MNFPNLSDGLSLMWTTAAEKYPQSDFVHRYGGRLKKYPQYSKKKN